MLVAGEIVVGDEEPLDALGVVEAHDPLQIVGRAEPALAPLHVDDGAERALVGAAAAEIDARQRARGAPHVLGRQDRGRLALERGQIVHVVVELGELAVPGIAQHLVEAGVLGLAGKERDPELLGGADIGRQLRQHGDAAGDVEAADADRQAGGEELAGEIDGARELVRLHPDEADQGAAAFAADHADDLVGPHPPVGLVIGVEADFDVRAQHLAGARVLGEAVEAGQRVGGDGRADPLDRIAVVVVMARLDHHEVEHVGVGAGGLGQCHDGWCSGSANCAGTVASKKRASQRYLGAAHRRAGRGTGARTPRKRLKSQSISRVPRYPRTREDSRIAAANQPLGRLTSWAD